MHNMLMTHLVKKTVKGHTYWYAVRTAWVNGRSKVVSQVYLGTAERIESLVKESKRYRPRIKSYPFGLPAALLRAAEDLNWVEIVDSHVDKKRVEGPSVGEYLLLLILGRASCPEVDRPLSKDGTGEWFRNTWLKFCWDVPYHLESQHLLNQMRYISDPETIRAIELDVSRRLVAMGLTPSLIFWDTTNFATEIEDRWGGIPRKGKSKKKRYDKNLVGLGLATSEENIPFMHETYPGNENDARLFSEVIDTLTRRLEALKVDLSQLVLVFDRGNNSRPNIKDVVGTPDHPKMHLVGGLKRNQVRDLMALPLEQYECLYTKGKDEILGYRTRRRVFDQEFTVVIRYNPATERKQKRRYEEKKEKFLGGMAALKQRYERKGGRGKPTSPEGARREAAKIIPQDYATIFKYRVHEDPKELRYWVVKKREKDLKDSFGKTSIFTDLHGWPTERISRTYDKKYLVEDDFKWLNNELIVPMDPFYVWKDGSIRVHAFLCVTGLLMLRYTLWKVRDPATRMGLRGLGPLEELKRIRIALTKEEGKRGAQWVVEELTATQAALFSWLGLSGVMKHLR